MKKFSKKGFSLMELMIVIAVIGVLSSIITVNLNGARTKSRDKAAYMQVMSTQSIAYKCIRSGISDVGLRAGNTSASMCVTDPDGTPVTVNGFPNWPSLTSGGGWRYDNSRFGWCLTSTLISSISSIPAIGAYAADGSRGGNNIIGKFCYRLQNDTDTNKYIICTQDGCTACTVSGGVTTCKTGGF